MNKTIEMTEKEKEIKEKGFEKRYGKKILLSGDSLINDQNELVAYRVIFKSPKSEYMIKEKLEKGLTDFVLLKYKKNGREFNHKYSKFIFAEIKVADLISEE